MESNGEKKGAEMNVKKHTRDPVVKWNPLRAVLCITLIFGVFTTLIVVEIYLTAKREAWKNDFFKANPSLVNPDMINENETERKEE